MKQITCLSELIRLKTGSILLWLPSTGQQSSHYPIILEIFQGTVFFEGSTFGYKHIEYHLRLNGEGERRDLNGDFVYESASFFTGGVLVSEDIDEILDYVPICYGLLNAHLIKEMIEQLREEM